jgi:ribosome recycling factor
MAAAKFDIKDLERRMRGAIDTLKKEFAGLRTGRASAHLLDPIVVNVYGQRMPINQVATVSNDAARCQSAGASPRYPPSRTLPPSAGPL